MSIFDSLNNNAAGVSDGPKSFSFNALPESLAELTALPESDLTTPFKTAALGICAFCAYAAAPEIGKEMINYLKGPENLSNLDISFINDRIRGKEYVPFSYFAGAVPGNDYTPTKPFTLTFTTNPYSFTQQGYAKLFVNSGGADSPREIVLRQKGSQWFLWNYAGILLDMRRPSSQDPWA